MLSGRELANPKPLRASREGRAHWYPYYAGYSAAFVTDMLKHLSLGTDALVLDPWNGSGTTTTVCALNGIPSHGYDINPSMVVVARARLLASNTEGSLPPLLKALIEQAKATPFGGLRDDPLLAWFGDGSVKRLRAVERSIRTTLVGPAIESPVAVAELSSLSSFFYVLLFRLVRKNLAGASSSNPTWVRSELKGVQRATLTWKDIELGLNKELANIRLLDKESAGERLYATADVQIGDSTELPLESSSVDAIITSPPYCTRIDYAVATRIELAILNQGGQLGFERLRREMIGTTLTNKAEVQTAFGEYTSDLMQQIKRHPSKASGGYYHSTYSDYFRKLQASLAHIARVLKPRGTATLVVQDSTYKELHIDLARVVTEALADSGLRMQDRWDFPVIRSMRQIHSVARNHMDSWRPTESVILLSKN